MAVGGTKQLTAKATYEDGTQHNVTSSSTWSSSDTSVATVQGGQVTGVAPGSVTISAQVDLPKDNQCTPPWFDGGCLSGPFSGSASGEVVSLTIGLAPALVAPEGQTTVTVTVLPAQAGRSVTLEALEAPNSGGHLHLGRPLGSFGATSGTTDSQGKFTTTYTASKFGGAESILATSGPAAASRALDVLVPGLTQLGSGTHYDLVGGTTPHPSNHFGTPTLNSKLVTVADQYFASFSEKLSYNDMSLVQGGLFDIGPVPSCPSCPFWAPPHQFHRLGRNCDINPAPLPTEKQETLFQIVDSNGGTIVLDCDAGCNYHTTF